MTVLDQIAQVGRAGGGWLGELRRGAAEKIRASGLPHRKLEAWRFTPIAPLDRVEFARDGGDAAALRAWGEEQLGGAEPEGCARIWVVNGAAELDAAPAGVSVARLAECGDDALVRRHLGRHARAEHFAALNAALFEHGLVVRFDRGARPDRPIHVIHVGGAGAAPASVYPRLLVLCGEEAEATVIETYLARPGEKLLVSAVTEVAVADSARLEHVRVVEGGGAYHVGSLAAQVGRGGLYASRVVTLGGALSRLDLDVVLDGEGAECSLVGAYHAGGRELVDHHTRIEHARPRGTSNESYRGIVDGRGQAVFDGTIAVRRDAQHTAAHQENRNLILSDGAGVNTKPHLEIDADDVVCSHGATVGALDEAQLFYLRARGISREQAEAMLTGAFLRPAVEAIGHAPVRARAEAALLARLPHGETIRGLAS
jgi:Fe-S cluster assembly protein SufD